MALQQGSQGKAVGDVQTALQRRGFKSSPDQPGVYGSSTANAVRSFQSRNGLVATGVVDQATWRALGLRGNVPRPTRID